MEQPAASITRLPGVGTRLDLVDEDGRPVTVVARSDGGCELYPPPGSNTLRLSAPSARAAGLALAGHIHMAPSVVERLDDVLGGLAIDAVRIPPGSPLADRSIADLAIRQRTGVTIAAVLRGSLPLVSPEPTEVLRPGDELVVLGRTDDVDEFTVDVAAGRG